MPAEPLRVAFRRQLREQALEQAYALTVEQGWDRVRMGQVATATGVSRPTLYKEFGDKQGLGEALVRGETERFLVGVQQALDGAPDVPQAVVAAVRYALGEAERSPLLRAVLTSTRGDDAGLLPLLTTRSAPLLEAAGGVLSGWLSRALPDHDERDVVEAADALARLVVSHLVQPAGTPDEIAERLARGALRVLQL
jgi:AcrR family transcriptional regulator